MTSYFTKEIFTDPRVRASTRTLDECERKYSTKYNGCVVKVERKFWIFTIYSHYGIYVHEEPFGSESIIHYTPETGGDFNGIVRETPVEDFLQGDSSMKICSCNFEKNVYSGAETVKRAREKLGQGDWDLLFNNCEHFAVWCKTGKKRCHQVKNALEVLGAAAMLVFIGIIAVAGAGGGSKEHDA